ncbi:MAG: hypothetical protein ACW98D_12120 [Promethearchaeota archaeon]|jgi:glucose-6-phosphate isomerase
MNKNLKLESYPSLKDSLLQAAIDKIKENRSKWDKPFFFDTKSYLDIDQVNKAIEPFLSEDTKNIIVLGTGGSIQTLLALKHLAKKRIFSITSSRVVELRRCLAETDPKNSIVIPISRGGETLDVNSTIGTFRNKGYKFLGLSSTGTMNEILREINCPILEVPDLSGRYAGSVTNVAIVPASIAGIKIEQFLKGLERGYQNFSSLDNNNRALEFSTYIYNLYKRNYKVIFSMPYSINLEGSTGLWVQGISESTGKDGKGLIGTYQEAPICQHSVLEYLLGGTKGIVIPILWTVEEELLNLDLRSSIDYVNGRNAQTIVNYQADATFQALIQQRVPSAKISIKNPSEESMGILISFILSSVYYLSLLIDINWANNPKVIVGKQICNKFLKDNINAEDREKLRSTLAKEMFENFY